MIIPHKFKPEFCTSKDKYRPALSHCWLKGNVLLATDGRRIVSIPITREEGDVDGYIPNNVLQAARAGAPRRKSRRSASDIAISAKAETFTFLSVLGPIDPKRPQVKDVGAFPSTEAVIKDSPVIHPNSFTFNVRLLVGLADAMGAETVTISNENDTGPITVQASSDADGRPISGAFGVLMPVREA